MPYLDQNGKSKANLSALAAQRRIQRVGAGELGFGEDMARHRGAHVGEREPAGYAERFDIERIDMEMIVMQQIVVPRRTRTVVAVVIARHRRVASEPAGEIVDALLGA